MFDYCVSVTIAFMSRTVAQPNDDPIQKLVQWATARPAIRAMLMTSTRAIRHGYTDALSDYDIILIVQDIHPFVADRSWLNDFGEVLVGYWVSDLSQSSFWSR